PGARHGTPRRRRRRVRPRSGGGEEVHRGGAGRQLQGGHVQRLRDHRTEIGPREGRGRKGRARGAQEDRGREGAVRVARRSEREGTHAAELRYWKSAGIDIEANKGPWYKETGSGMGPALNTASSMGAYILADRGTWLSFKNRGDLAILVEGDRKLFNQYGIMLVNPAKHPNVKVDLGNAFINWVVSPAGQKAIADYKVGGEQLFFPNYKAG